MIRHRTTVGVVLCLVIIPTAVCPAELTPAQTKTARALVRQFADRRFAVRQEAVDKLVAMGPDVIPLVRKTLAATDDAEVKLRCEMVIKQIARRPLFRRRLVERRVRDLGRSSWEKLRVRRTPNGGGVAFIDINGIWLSIVHNGKKGPNYSWLEGHVAMSPDGRHVSYPSRRVDRYFIFRDGVEGPYYDEVMWPVFSPDGKHLAYSARRRQKWFIVRDGKKGPACDAIGQRRFSPDSRHLVYQARRGDRKFIVLDGVEGSAHDHVWLPKTPRKLRYIVMDDGRGRLVEVDWPKDGQKPERPVERELRSLGKMPPEFPKARSSYRSASPEHLVLEDDRPKVVFMGRLSPHSDSLAYWVERDGKQEMFVNGKRVGSYDDTVYMRFSTDGEHFAFRAKRDGKPFVVLDGKESPTYEEVRGPRLSLDGKHLAYTAKRDDEYFVVRDGRELARHDRWISLYDFSPDGRHLPYRVRRGDKRYIVCNGKRGPEYDRIEFVRFSPDSRHLSYWAQRRREWFMVCDGAEGPRHARAWQDWMTCQPFENTTAFRYLVLDGNREWLVEVDWPKDRDWTNGLEPIER